MLQLEVVLNEDYNMSTELYHHGILGQKWGVRRYQNADGTWTEAGKKRYGKDITKESIRKVDRQLKKHWEGVPSTGEKIKYSILDKHRDEIKEAAKRATAKAEDPELYKDLKGYNEANQSKNFNDYLEWMDKHPNEYAEACDRWDKTLRKEMQPVLDRYVKDYRTELLSEMGYQPTKQAIDYLSKNEKKLKYYFETYPQYHEVYDWVGD